MTLFTEKSLNLMPSQALTGLSNSLLVDKEAKQVSLATANNKIAKLSGTSVLRNPVAGRIQVANGEGPSAATTQESMSAPAVSVSNGASLLNNSEMNPNGAPVYVPGTVPPETSSQDIAEMSSEVNSYFSTTETPTSNITTGKISVLQIAASEIAAGIKQIDTTIDLISLILERRANGELPNPALNFSALNLDDIPEFAKEKLDAALDANENLIQNKIIAPFVANQRILNTLKAQASGILGDLDPVFDLDFGPPISTTDRFVLSQDGLYYNSRTAKVPDIVPYPVSANMWNLQYDSNRGGRGLSFTEEDGESTVNTIFDLNKAYEKENPRVKDFLEFDDILQQFEDDKMSHMTEVSGYISEILANGYGPTDAIVQSYTAQLGAVASVYDGKIKKRKRQLTIAAVYGRNDFAVTNRTHPLGEGLFFQYEPPQGKAFEYKLQYKELPDKLKSVTFYTLEGGQTVPYNTQSKQVVDVQLPENILAKVGSWKQIPRIPVNDFSYLKQSDIPLNAQKNITLFSEDLNTVIVPYQARYVVAPTDRPVRSVDSLAVDPIGLGDWTHRQTYGSLSATTPLYKSLTDDIVSDGLLACYNFLDPDAVTQPSGTLYALNNAAEGSTRLDAKLVGWDKSLVFPSGVGQAYFAGTIFDERESQNPLWANVSGSYARLPNSTRNYNLLEPNIPFNGVRPLDNLFYSKKGISIDFWAYVPNVHKNMTDTHRYRLAFANENSGPVASNYVAASTQSKAGGTNFARTIGMIMGWRDQGSPKTNTLGAYPFYSSGLEFCIAPTVGQNQSYTTTPQTSWGHSVCLAERWAASAGITPPPGETTQVGMFIPSSVLTSSGYGIQDVSSGYHHINISFDYNKEKVDFHFDGELLTTSSLTDVLGGSPNDTVLPTAVKMNLENQTDVISFNDPTTESFLGNTVYDERCTPERVAFPVFTPWIIGGGYTDNIPRIPGTSSRPQGFLGSNANNFHQQTQKGDSVSSITLGNLGDYPVGQHDPPLSGGTGGTHPARRQIPRSGLDGFIGSFKIYSRPLNTSEAKINYDSQKGFFHNILISSPE
jgi:hypothetical protein